jgi:hypothetical protein
MIQRLLVLGFIAEWLTRRSGTYRRFNATIFPLLSLKGTVGMAKILRLSSVRILLSCIVTPSNKHAL